MTKFITTEKESFKKQDVITLLSKYVHEDQFDEFLKRPENIKNINDIVYKGHTFSGLFEGLTPKNKPTEHYAAKLEFLYDRYQSKIQNKPVFKNKLHFKQNELIISATIHLANEVNTKIPYTFTPEEISKLKNKEQINFLVGNRKYIAAVDNDLNKIFFRTTDFLKLNTPIKGFILNEEHQNDIRNGKIVTIQNTNIQFNAILGNLTFTQTKENNPNITTNQNLLVKNEISKDLDFKKETKITQDIKTKYSDQTTKNLKQMTQQASSKYKKSVLKQ